MADTLLTIKPTNIITIAVMDAIIIVVFLLITYGVHVVMGNTSNG